MDMFLHSGSAARSQGRLVRRELAVAARCWEPLVLPLLFAAAIVVVAGRYPLGQNSDGLLPAVMSLQKLTLFYWGQDRFANLLPAVTSWIADPAINLGLQLLLRIVFAVLAPLFPCAVLLPRGGQREVWSATLVATALLLAFAPQQIIREAFTEASPYGTSFALAGLAVMAFRAARGRHATAQRCLGLALMLAAVMVNVALVLVAAPLLLGALLTSSAALAAEAGFASLLALVVTGLAMRMFGMGPQTSNRFAETLIGLRFYAGQMLGKLGFFFWGMAGLAVLTYCLLRRGRARDAHLGRMLVLAFAWAVSFLAVGLSSWVVLNFMYPRYLVPDYFLGAALGGMCIVRLLAVAARHPAARAAAVLATGAILLGGAAARHQALCDRACSLIVPEREALADALALVVARDSLDGVIGEYWDVWPAVFRAMQLHYAAGQPSKPLFGVTLRGNARHTGFVANFLRQGHVRLACLDGTSVECDDRIADMMGPSVYRRLPTSDVAGTLPDGHVYRVITILPVLDGPE